MKQYFVIHSYDPYLLARLCTDLQMEGLKRNPTSWNSSPFDDYEYNSETELREGNTQNWCMINKDKTHRFSFYNHDGVGYDRICLTLTSRNYLAVLTKILTPWPTSST